MQSFTSSMLKSIVYLRLFRHHSRLLLHLRYLTITYGTSMSSSVESSALISNIMFFWWLGIGLRDIVSRTWDILSTQANRPLVSESSSCRILTGTENTHFIGIRSFSLLGP
jgi:hypothetical protein